jgi:hypothetical protein
MRARWNNAMLATVAILYCCFGQCATITATTGDNQSAPLLTAVPVALSAKVTESNTPVQNAIVTFTAPSSGASGTFVGGLFIVTVITDTNGIATAPDFTAGSISGPYQVTATMANTSGPANFNLTNVPGPVDHFVFEMPGGGSFANTEVLPNSFTIQYQLTAKDVYNNTVTNFNGSVPLNYGVQFRNGGGGGGDGELGVFTNGISPQTVPTSLTVNAGSFGAGVDPPASGGGWFTICHPGDAFNGPNHAPTSSGSEFTAINLGQEVTFQLVPPFETYAGTIHIISSDPKAILPPDYTFSGDGAHTFTAIFYTEGIQSIGCYDVAAVSIHDNQQNGSLPAWWDVKGPFNNLSAPTITAGTPTTTLGGRILFGTSIPTGAVSISVGSSAASANIDQATGDFSASLDTSALSPASSPYAIIYLYPGDTNNAATSATAYLFVLKQSPPLTWTSPVDISYGVALNGTQLNAKAEVPGAFTYSPSPGTVLNAGASQTLSVLFIPNDTVNYSTSTATVTINVAKATPSIVWANPADILIGVALGPAQLDATANTTGAFIYSPSAGTILNAGASQALSVLFVPTDSTNFTTATATVSINVANTTPSITWANPTDIVFGTALGAAQLDATANTAGVFTYSPSFGTILDAGANQTLSVLFTPTDTVNFATATANVNINVVKATPSITWANPSDIVFGIALGSEQLDATANTTGAFIYAPSSGTVLNAGTSQVLSALFVPTDLTNFTMATANVNINVVKATPSITWANPPGIIFGTALGPAQLDATASTAGVFTYSPSLGTVLNAGADQALSVLFTPNDTVNFTTATATVSINVAKATPSITWANPADIVFGMALGPAQLDATANTTGTFIYAPSSGTVLNAGASQALSALFVPTDSTNFTTVTATVSINVAKATPSITWANPSDIVFGTALWPAQLDATANTTGAFIYTPSFGIVLNAGASQALSALFVPTDSTNFTTATATVSINVVKATPSIAWANPSDIVFGTALGPVQLDAAASTAGVFTYSPSLGTVLNAGSDQALSVLFTPNDTVNFMTAIATVSINVLNKPTITWNTPADISFGTPLGLSQLNATANTPGAFTYTPAAGTILDAGAAQTLSVLFTPSDATNYTTATAIVSINVLKVTPMITWKNPADTLFGVPIGAAQFNASADTQGTFVYTPMPGTVLNAGAGQTLSVLFTPTDATDFTTASKSVIINVSKAAPVITWSNPAGIVAGTALSSAQLNATANTRGAFTYTPAAGTVLGVGTGQTLAVLFTPADGSDFTTTTASVSIDVLNAAPVFTSAPMATPNAVTSGMAVSFSAAASDVDTDSLTYSWDFGDGASGSGATTTHEYTAPGTFMAVVTATDSHGASLSASVVVAVFAATIPAGDGAMLTDSNGDGIPDAIQSVADANEIGTPTAEETLGSLRLAISLNFARAATDKISLDGNLTLPAGFAPSGAVVIFDIGGVVRTFKLNTAGRAMLGADSFTLKLSKMGGAAKFSIRLQHGSFADTLRSLMPNATVSKQRVTIPIAFLLGGELWTGGRMQVYTATKGRAGNSRDTK